MPDELLTIDELALFLKCKKGSIYQKVHHKQIPYIKASGLRFIKSDILKWLDSHKFDPINPPVKKIRHIRSTGIRANNSNINRLVETAKQEVMKNDR